MERLEYACGKQRPNSETGMEYSEALGSISHVSGSMSTNCGIARACNTAAVVAAMVMHGTETGSPGSTPSATSALCSVAVPLTHDTANFAPTNWANASSNAATDPVLRNHALSCGQVVGGVDSPDSRRWLWWKRWKQGERDVLAV